MKADLQTGQSGYALVGLRTQAASVADRILSHFSMAGGHTITPVLYLPAIWAIIS